MTGAFDQYGSWEAGVLANLGRRSALGATALLGVGGAGSVRTGVRARYRHWLGDDISVEIASGPIRMTVEDAHGASGVALTSDLRINYQDRFSVSGGFDYVNSQGFGAGNAGYVGASLGSKYALLGTAVAGVLVLVGVMVAASSMN